VDPDPAVPFNEDPDPAVPFNEDPDPAFKTNADPDPGKMSTPAFKDKQNQRQI
jgi:hypothetical protein